SGFTGRLTAGLAARPGAIARLPRDDATLLPGDGPEPVSGRAAIMASRGTLTWRPSSNSSTVAPGPTDTTRAVRTHRWAPCKVMSYVVPAVRLRPVATAPTLPRVSPGLPCPDRLIATPDGAISVICDGVDHRPDLCHSRPWHHCRGLAGL